MSCINDIPNIEVSCSSVLNDIPDVILFELWKSDILKKYEINGNSPISFYLDWEKINEIHPFEEWKKEFLRINNKQF